MADKKRTSDKSSGKRTEPTREPLQGGSYDLETGDQLEGPDEHKAAERDESITDGQEEE